MRLRFILVLGLTLGTLSFVRAEPTPEKAAQFEKRFKEGKVLFDDGKEAEALKVFDAILAEEPKARGSLFFGGWSHLNLGEYDPAADYLKKFLELDSPVAQKFRALILAIQANQSLRRVAAVESLRKQLYDLRSSGQSIPGLTDAKMFTREKIKGPNDTTYVIAEGFDPKVEPNRAWQLDVLDADLQLQRTLVLSYDAKSTAEFQTKDKKLTGVEVYYLSELHYKDGKTVQVDVYRQEIEKPAYETCRQWMLDAVKQPPAPLFSDKSKS
jgi:tetratricopeptide (TPR) repeat protein